MEIADAHAESRTQPRLQFGAEQRIAAQQEEIVVPADRNDSEQLLEDGRDRTLSVVARRRDRSRRIRRRWRDQCERLPVDLPGRRLGKGVQEHERRRQHVRRKASREPAAEHGGYGIGRLAHRDICDQPRRIRFAVDRRRQNGGLGDPGTLRQRGVDLGQVDRVPAHLHPAPVAAEEMQVARVVEPAEVAAPVLPPTRLARILGERRGVELRPTPVARAHVGAADDEVAHLVRHRFAAVGTLDQHAHALGTAAHRDDRTGRHRIVMADGVLRDEPDLGRGELVHESAAIAGVGAEKLDVTREDGLPAEVHDAQMRQHPARREAIAELAEDRRNGMEHGDALAIEPVCQRRQAVATQVVRAKRRTVKQAPVHIHVRCAEAQRVEDGKAIRLVDAERLDIGVHEVLHVPVRLTDAFRPASRARRVAEIEDGVGRNLRQRSSTAVLQRLADRRDVDDRATRRRNGLCALEQVALRQQGERLAVLQDELQPLRRIAGVQEDIGATGPGDPEHRFDCRDLAFEKEPDSSVAASAHGENPLRNGVRRRIELAIRDPGIALDDGGSLRNTIGDLRKA